MPTLRSLACLTAPLTDPTGGSTDGPSFGRPTPPGMHYPYPWHKQVEIAPGHWSVIGDISLTVGAPFESCAAASCPGPRVYRRS